MTMPTAKEMIAAGNLTAAIAEITQQVRNRPTDLTARITLFELLCLVGDLDRAEKQIDVVEQQRSQKDLGVQVYRNCLNAERERRRVFQEGIQPHFLKEPPSYVDLHLEAICCVREGKLSQARELLDRAEEERPAFPGKLGGVAFKDFRDGDDFTAPVVEIVVHDKYTWLPIELLRLFVISSPKPLRDMIWASARVLSGGGVVGDVLVPVLYPGTSQHANDSVRLGRMTEWQTTGEALVRPVGLRVFLVDDQDHAFFELGSVEFGEPGSAVAES
jgi:type VI secretion system protein ImpE